jgi:hypothetical protein
MQLLELHWLLVVHEDPFGLGPEQTPFWQLPDEH